MSYSCAMKLMINGCAASLLSALLFTTAASAESAWVSDEFEITLRSGPSTSNAIELMLNSGTELEVLERDAESGYSRVRTGGGTEGWVLTRYLMNEPARRETLERDKSGLEEELAEIKRTAANILAINNQNKQLREQLAAEEIRVATLEQENRELSSQTTRYWFMSGGLVLLVGSRAMAATDPLATQVALRSILIPVRVRRIPRRETATSR